MDRDYTNRFPETQMDLMAMMIEMEKLNELCEPLPSLELCSGPMPTICNATTTTTTTNTTPPPLLAGLPSSLSFSNSPAQDTMLHQMFSVPPAGTELSFAGCEQRRASMAAMREMIFRIAAMQPVHIDPESVKPPKRRNVRISKDPQSVAARHRRERISERIRILQRLVPGGTKMDTASMLDEAIHYVKFLKNQVQSLERATAGRSLMAAAFSHATRFSNGTYSCQGFVNPTQM